MINLAVELGKIMTPQNKVIGFTQESVLAAINNIHTVKKIIELRGNSIQPVYKKGFVDRGKKSGKYIVQSLLKK